uniref:Predicted protein n=1 Tax=Physcomitrium patens TaxID=3218 RepID=A9TUZ7_PHYPA
MRALVQDYLKEHETTPQESASYGARVDDDLGRSMETSEFWASAISTMQEGKLPREALLRTAATIRGTTDVKIWIGDVVTEQHFFVQDITSYPLILRQPYIMATRMETKILDDGSAYARVCSEDGRKAVQFLIVPPNHEQNRDRLMEKPLPKIVEGFKDFGEVPL